MAGFREFVTGEVLTAANVDNFLMKQSVQKYADAAARDAALGVSVGGGNALREGMVAYLDDEDEVQYFDGTAWNPVGGAPPAGIGPNVVTAATSTQFNTTANSYTDITGLVVNITPTSATSKILVIVQLYNFQNDGTTSIAISRFSIGRNGTALADDIIRVPLSNLHVSMSVLDSPETTSSVAYSAMANNSISNGTCRVNLGGVALSRITAIEVAG